MIGVDELKRVLGIATTDTSRDDDIRSLEAGAVAAVENLVERYFGEIAERTQYLSGGGRVLWLDEMPVQDPDDVTTPLVTLHVQSSAGVYTAIAATDYELRGYTLHRFAGNWTKGEENYRAVYFAGYAAGEEPADVRAKVIEVAALLWRGQTTGGFKSETFGTGYSYTLSEAQIADLPGADAFITHWRWLR